MRYEVPINVTVDVFSKDNVVAAARAELQRHFAVTDEEWLSRDQPFIDEHFGHALAIVLTSHAVSGAVTGIVERTVPGLEVSGFGVTTSQVTPNPEGWEQRIRIEGCPGDDREQ